eukprot:3050163-Pyramimonas_sp.AAC.1
MLLSFCTRLRLEIQIGKRVLKNSSSDNQRCCRRRRGLRNTREIGLCRTFLGGGATSSSSSSSDGLNPLGWLLLGWGENGMMCAFSGAGRAADAGLLLGGVAFARACF